MALSLLPYDFDEIRIFDDKLDDIEIMRRIIALENLEDPFHLLDVGDVVRKHRVWIDRIPRVVPHYAVKCNPNPTVIKTLAALGANFDCASKNEIVTVLAYGVHPDRIIFANPVKTPSQIKYAQKVRVSKMTADNLWELRKIKDFYPDAKVIIRFRCDSAISDAYLGQKFGCEPGDEAERLIRECRNLNLELHGFSFHAGSPCGEVAALSRGINICKYLIDVARSYGHHDVQLIDIGGGIPGESDFFIDEVWSYFKTLEKSFMFKHMLFNYRDLIFWLPDYYRTNWTNYKRYKKVTYKHTTTTTSTNRLALPWRP